MHCCAKSVPELESLIRVAARQLDILDDYSRRALTPYVLRDIERLSALLPYVERDMER